MELQINWDKVKPTWKYRLVAEKVEALVQDETSKMLTKLGLSRPCIRTPLPNEYTVDIPMAQVMEDLKLKFKPAQGMGHASMVGHLGAYTFVLRDGAKGHTRILVRTFR